VEIEIEIIIIIIIIVYYTRRVVVADDAIINIGAHRGVNNNKIDESTTIFML